MKRLSLETLSKVPGLKKNAAQLYLHSAAVFWVVLAEDAACCTMLADCCGRGSAELREGNYKTHQIPACWLDDFQDTESVLITDTCMHFPPYYESPCQVHFL